MAATPSPFLEAAQQLPQQTQTQLRPLGGPTVYPFYSQPMGYVQPPPPTLDPFSNQQQMARARQLVAYDEQSEIEQRLQLDQALGDLLAGRPQSTVRPIEQLQRRPFESEAYLAEQRPSRAARFQPSDMSPGPGIFAITDLHLIPLQRVPGPSPIASPATPTTATAAIPPTVLNVTAVPIANPNVMPSVNVMPSANANIPAAPTAWLTPNAVQVRAGNVGAAQFLQQDAPRGRLSKEWDDYLAGIAAWYTAMVGVIDVPAKLEPTCRGFDVDEDSVGVTEAMLECLLLWLTEAGRNNIKPLFFTFPLHAACMSLPLRLTIYGGQNAEGGYMNAFTWRQSPDRRLANEPVDAETAAMRAGYQKFLANLYSVMWRALMRRRLERVGMASADFDRFLESALATAAPQLMTVRVLEARILAIAARFQTAGEFFNTSQFLDEALKYRTIIDSQIANLLTKYAYFATI
jgi:hypothetical protein